MVYPVVIIKWEKWDEIRDEILPLWTMHNSEIASPEDQPLFDPDWDKFDECAKMGKDHWVTLRDDGELVGYVFALVDTHTHRKATLSAFWDLYWVRPDYRKGMTGIRLLKAARDSLWARGVCKQYTGVKMWKDVGRLFERLGFKETERLYTITSKG